MASETAPPADAAPQPIVLLISIERTEWFDEMHGTLIDALHKAATIKRSSNCASTVRYFANNTPSAVIITDPSIMKPANREALASLKTYVGNGGKAVFGCDFSSFVKPNHMDVFWRSTFGLPWKSGDYHRTTVHLNQSTKKKLGSSTHDLQTQYSQKAVFLRGVTRNNSLYLPSATSMTESHVFSSAPVDAKQAAVAWAKFNDGWIGYVGDVNAEAGSTMAILNMCGL